MNRREALQRLLAAPVAAAVVGDVAVADSSHEIALGPKVDITYLSNKMPRFIIRSGSMLGTTGDE